MSNNIKKQLAAACALLSISALPVQAYEPITFEKYLFEVAANNLEYLSGQYNVRMADAEVAMQRVFQDPELCVEVAEDIFILELSYTLGPGKRRSRVDMAKTGAEIEILALEWFFQELRAEAAAAFAEALLQRELLEVKRDSYDYMACLAVLDSIRCSIGEISDNDAWQTRAEAAALQNDVYRQEGEYHSALVMLNLYMGNDSGVLRDPKGRWIEVREEYDLAALVDLGMERRADLVAANKSVDLALRNIEMVKTERRPDIEIMVGYEMDWHGFLPNRRDYLKAGVSIPLKFSNFNKAAVRQAGYAAGQSEIRQKNMELQVRTEISKAYYAYESLGRQVAQFRSGPLDEAQALQESMACRYGCGEIDIAELLIARRAYNDVREDYLTTLKEYASASIELQKCSGIWDVDF